MGEGVKADAAGPEQVQQDATDAAGKKFDGEKPMLQLVPRGAMFAVGEVLAYGCKKYDRENWRKGIDPTRNVGAALRHIYQWLDGENVDQESELHHLAHAITDLMMAYETHANGLAEDNRWSALKERGQL